MRTFTSWDPHSTYIQEPPFLVDLTAEVRSIQPIHGARVLAVLGDSVTTDHISPAGSIAKDSPAGKYLIAHQVAPRGFQQLRLPTRQRSRDDSRHVCQHPDSQPAGTGNRRRLDASSSRTANR